jgi:hypothetical protein
MVNTEDTEHEATAGLFYLGRIHPEHTIVCTHYHCACIVICARKYAGPVSTHSSPDIQPEQSTNETKSTPKKWWWAGLSCRADCEGSPKPDGTQPSLRSEDNDLPVWLKVRGLDARKFGADWH